MARSWQRHGGQRHDAVPRGSSHRPERHLTEHQGARTCGHCWSYRLRQVFVLVDPPPLGGAGGGPHHDGRGGHQQRWPARPARDGRHDSSGPSHPHRFGEVQLGPLRCQNRRGALGGPGEGAAQAPRGQRWRPGQQGGGGGRQLLRGGVAAPVPLPGLAAAPGVWRIAAARRGDERAGCRDRPDHPEGHQIGFQLHHHHDRSPNPDSVGLRQGRRL
mmetsp:Transcript_66312/g.158216  ORF Transcript_66312/g.158216 Transcript_66312/m.158216 type:complete len:216 (+) Transcript_66312:2865-3512(+)